MASYTEAHHSHLRIVDQRSRSKLEIDPGVPRGDQDRRTQGERWLFDTNVGDKLEYEKRVARLALSVIGALSKTYTSAVNPSIGLIPGKFYKSKDFAREVHESSTRFGRLLQNSDSINKPFSALSEEEKEKLLELYKFLFSDDNKFSLYSIYLKFMERMELPINTDSLMIVRE